METVIELQLLDPIIQMACSQTLWQFIGTIEVTRINRSTFQAKENAVMTLFYVNTLRTMLLLIMEKSDNQLVSLEFMSNMATIKVGVYEKCNLMVFGDE